jgi:hypothetical protein
MVLAGKAKVDSAEIELWRAHRTNVVEATGSGLISRTLSEPRATTSFFRFSTKGGTTSVFACNLRTQFPKFSVKYTKRCEYAQRI